MFCDKFFFIFYFWIYAINKQFEVSDWIPRNDNNKLIWYGWDKNIIVFTFNYLFKTILFVSLFYICIYMLSQWTMDI